MLVNQRSFEHNKYRLQAKNMLSDYIKFVVVTPVVLYILGTVIITYMIHNRRI